MSHFATPRISPEVTDRLRMAAAVAAEQVLDEHVRSVVELVEEAAGRAPVDRLIAAYVRLHYLRQPEATRLRERLLAALGRSGSAAGVLAAPRSPFARLRRRLRGRVDGELRDWVEQHSARVELAVLDIHVQNALDTVQLVHPSIPAGQSISIYCEMLELRETMAEMVRLRVLKALHDRESGGVEPIRPDRAGPYPFRVAENDR